MSFGTSVHIFGYHKWKLCQVEQPDGVIVIFHLVCIKRDFFPVIRVPLNEWQNDYL